MPGIDIDRDKAARLDALPDRLATLLLDATTAVEREAADGKAAAEAIARKVGVIARSGAALALFDVRLQRRGARRVAGDADATEEADMDDADDDDAAAEGDAYSDADYERAARNLSRNLRLGPFDGGPAEGPGDADAATDHAQLGGARAPPPMAA